MPFENGTAVLGIDFGATNVKGVLVDAQGQTLGRFIEPSNIHDGQEATLGRLGGLVKEKVAHAGAMGARIESMGLGVCGPVNQADGTVTESPVLPGWKDVPFMQVLSDATGLRVVVDNDSNAAVLGEWWKGAAQGSSVVAGLTLGTGIGGGLVIDGQIYRGASGLAGEFGHISLAAEPPCPCGGHGCLGRLASATATLARYHDLVGAESPMLTSLADLATLVESGDAAARKSIQISADYVAEAVLMLVNCLNPEVFVLCGGMALLGDALLIPARKRLNASTFRQLRQDTRIVAGELGLFSGCFGAALLASSGENVLPKKIEKARSSTRPGHLKELRN
ncbi:MAG TPA: ROK family protein [Thermoanaerobaculia bacterium]|nr:ROK family protein [Thermoanaerobaculia bacterium]